MKQATENRWFRILVTGMILTLIGVAGLPFCFITETREVANQIVPIIFSIGLPMLAIGKYKEYEKIWDIEKEKKL